MSSPASFPAPHAPAAALPAAVLWDLDGTLVDTERHWMAAEGALVTSFGAEWTHEQALQLVGLGLETSAAILQEAGVRLAAHEIIDRLTAQVMTTIVDEGLPLRPGAVELLSDLRAAGVRCGLVTMSMRRMARVVADQLPPGAFEVIVAGDDATRPKPFPDAYLQACAALRVAPGDAVAIEDSPTGVRAAVAAGVTTVGVPLMVSLEGAGAHELWPTLSGRRTADVAAVYAAHAGRAARAVRAAGPRA